ncbi:Putative pilx9 protein, putative conjugal transfer protein, putative exported protein [Escherichia coli]|uniref:Pilx9 protein, putative conjugal transfer protein, putative exported protein n=1 Tax=Escherichia coli TaxID=562 RepID=A0A377BG06_ECOLX|nr:Putative pilx9 protein, putative conjugal transfer protein, putative exported protein [Escherichia coli]
MKMNKGALIMALLMAAHVCNAAVLPSGSRFDPRNQIVSYNPNNTTIINSAVGYTTTLVFDEDETVISARTGFPQGWAVNKEDNLVYLEVRPVKQTVQKIIRMQTVTPLLNPSVLLLTRKMSLNAGERICLFAPRNVITAWS